MGFSESCHTEAPAKGSQKHAAFTLAEVLVTLGIIGVVAALTIPTLINNFQQKVLDKQFKKSYALINQAMQNARGQFDYLPRCAYFTSASGLTATVQDCRELNEKFWSNFKTAKICKANNAFNDGCIPEYNGANEVLKEIHKDDEDFDPDYWDAQVTANCPAFSSNKIKTRPTYVLADGTILFSYYDDNPTIIAIDLNGMKGPNKWGYDLFQFILKSDGNKFAFEPGGCASTEPGGVSTDQKLKELFGSYPSR